MTYVILTGNIDLSVGSFMTLCGCLTSILIAQKGMHTFAAIGLALVAALLFGALNGALITKMRIPAFILHRGHCSVPSQLRIGFRFISSIKCKQILKFVMYGK